MSIIAKGEESEGLIGLGSPLELEVDERSRASTQEGFSW